MGLLVVTKISGKPLILIVSFLFVGTEDIILYTVVDQMLLDTIASICRTLSKPESHVLLAGPSGSIKFDALHIACTYLGIKIASITPVKNYNMNDFYNDLKVVSDHFTKSF